jgi:hypothetical protein
VNECGGGGVLWVSWLGRGARNRSEIEGGSVEIFQVLDVFIPNSLNRMTGGSLLSVAKRRGARYCFRKEVSGLWAIFLPGPKGYPASFSSFLIFFSFSFLFSFDFWFEKLLQNLSFEFGQLLNSCESFPLLF